MPFNTPLRFATGIGGTQVVTIGTSSILDNLANPTVMAWILMDSLSDVFSIFQKGIGANAGNAFNVQASGALSYSSRRATTNAGINATAFTPALIVGHPFFVAASYDLNTTGNNLGYVGDVNTPASEPSSYVSQQTGSGAQVSNATRAAGIGNNSPANNSGAQGKIFICAIWNRILSLAEIREQQASMLRGHPVITSGCLGYWPLGPNGSEKVLDLSGNQLHGTVTSAIPTNDYLPRHGGKRVA